MHTTLQLAVQRIQPFFKLLGRPEPTATLGAGTQHRRQPITVSLIDPSSPEVFFTEATTFTTKHPKINFLVDSGSAVSLLPLSFRPEQNSHNLDVLRAANGSPIRTAGSTILYFTLPSFEQPFTWTFIVADVEFPILGADFFTHFGILIDCQNKQLQNTTPKNNTHKHTAPILKTTIIQKLTNNRYSNLITNTSKHVHFADEFNKPVNKPKHDITTNRNTKTCKQAQHTTNSQPQQTLHNTTDHENIKPYTAALPQELIDYINTACKNTITKSKTVNSKYNTQHNIITTCHPIKQKLRPIPPDIRSAVEKEFLTLEKDGIVRRSASPWATPLHIVTKKDGTVRPCGDYRLLNSATVPDSYPLPLITDIFHRITSSTIFFNDRPSQSVPPSTSKPDRHL